MQPVAATGPSWKLSHTHNAVSSFRSHNTQSDCDGNESLLNVELLPVIMV
jgi:hypothetical protein